MMTKFHRWLAPETLKLAECTSTVGRRMDGWEDGWVLDEWVGRWGWFMPLPPMPTDLLPDAFSHSVTVRRAVTGTPET